RQLRAARRRQDRRGPGDRRGRLLRRGRPAAPVAPRPHRLRAHLRRAGGSDPQVTRRLGPGKLVIATHNAGKLKEIAALLAPHGVDCISAGALGLPEPDETGRTFVENALLKAHAAAKASGLAALADDSGLSVTALDGRPGVYTADWAERQWFEGSAGRDWYMA